MKPIFLFFLFITFSCTAQNTLSFSKETTSPKASIKDASWIAGSWKGEAFGGITEEVWSPPLGGSMMFVFKLVNNDKVAFYEVGHIAEVDETLIFQLKHFHEDLKGWEEKNETVDAKLIKIEENRIYFDDFTFEKISNNEMNIYVVIGQSDGTEEEVKFNYKKVQ